MQMLRLIISLLIKLIVVYGFFYKELNLPEVFFYNLISSILIYFELLKRIKTPNWAFCLFLIDAAIPLLSTFIFLVLGSLRPIYINVYRNKDNTVNIELEQDNLNINSINDHEVVESDFNRTMQYQEAKINKFDKNDIEDENLLEWRQRLKQYIPDEAKDYFIENNSETHLQFPVEHYPEKPNSLNLKKQIEYSGKLVGVKGQYLIFGDNTVFNIRANEGLVVEINI